MMHPGIVGALALVGTAGAIYFGSGYLNDYFAARNADTAVETAAQAEGTDNTPSSLVGDVTEAPDEAARTETADATASDADTMADMAEEVAEAATEEMAALGDGVADAASDMVDPVQETAEETLERVLETAPRNATEASEQEVTPEPGTTPVLDIVRIEPTGEAVIAGNAPQGERVGLLYNNELIADSDVDAGGDFVLIPDQPIPSGEGTMEIVVIDDAGNTVMPSQEQVAVVLPEDGSTDGFLVGVLRPNEPVDIIERQAPDARPEVEVAARVEPASPAETAPAETPAAETAEATASTDVVQEAVQAPEVEVAARVEPTQPVEADQAAAAEAFVIVDAIELEGREMWIAGGALPGTVIRLYQDNVFLGEVITGEEGRYLFEGTLLDAEGDVTVRADALVTGSADVIARAEVPFEVPLSSAQIAAVALEQVEDAVATVEENTVEVAEVAQEQVADVAQEQVANALEIASEAVTDIAEAVQEQAATAVEAASDVADTVADTTAVDAVQEGTATAIETATEVADTASEQIADAAETVLGTAEVVTEDVAQVASIEAPQVEIAATTTPSTPPTEALAQALEDAAAATTTETEAPAADVVAEVATTAAQTDAPAADVVAEVATTAGEAEAPAADVVVEVAATADETEAPAADVVVEVAATADETEAPAADVVVEVAATADETEAPAADVVVEVAATAAQTEAPVAEVTAEAAATVPSTEAPASAAQVDATPAPAAEEAAATTTPASTSTTQPERISVLDTGQVIIRRGDNLWRLSRRVYGQGIRYTSIYDANRDQIGQPELIFPGQVFTLPTPQEEWGAVPGLEALDADQIPADRQETQ